jgi:hypothetical protein
MLWSFLGKLLYKNLSDHCTDDSSSDSHSGATRTKKHAPESGAFGKSTRRSRSKTGTPAKREDPTILAADAIFSKYLSESVPVPPDSSQRKNVPPSSSQSNLVSQPVLPPIDGGVSSAGRYVQKVPTEVILRGYKSTHQYAAIQHYESIAGHICEDYPRDPPPEQRKFKTDTRDPSTLRTRPLTPGERVKAMRFAGGENWIKVTFESAEAAEAAIYSSPQTILGYLVYAEPYRGMPPTSQEAIPAEVVDRPLSRPDRFQSQTVGPASSSLVSRGDRRTSSTLPRSFTTPSMTQIGRGQPQSLSPPGSNTSSSTLDTATLSTATASSATATSLDQSSTHPLNTPQIQTQDETDGIYCRRIPTAKRMKLLPADQALLPQPSYTQRILAKIPLLAFFSASLIGNEIPRTESGEFDWQLASIYWRTWWWLDFWFGLCGGDIVGGVEKDN